MVPLRETVLVLVIWGASSLTLSAYQAVEAFLKSDDIAQWMVLDARMRSGHFASDQPVTEEAKRWYRSEFHPRWK